MNAVILFALVAKPLHLPSFKEAWFSFFHPDDKLFTGHVT